MQDSNFYTRWVKIFSLALTLLYTVQVEAKTVLGPVVNKTSACEMLPCVTCPPEWVNVQCGQLDPNLNYGSPTITGSNCGVMISGPYVEGDVQGCGSGTITKTWNIWTYFGEYQCVQHIMVGGGSGGGVYIHWPYDITLLGCSAGTEPSQLSPPHNFPTWNAPSCSNLMYTWRDEVYYPYGSEGGICKKIFRRWKVIDWCCYDVDNPYSGCQWTHTQIIKIMDQQPPSISCPADMTVDAGPNCSGNYVNIPLATGYDNCGEVTITNNSPYDTYGGANASGVYPPGVTTIKFTATDICGNKAECYTRVTVTDKKKPTPVVFHGLTTNLMCMAGGAMIDVNPKWFDAGSFDNCTPRSQLKFSAQPNRFTCDDRGYNDIWITVEDNSGNKETVKTYVIIADNQGCCGLDTIDPPTITCGSDITVDALTADCSASNVQIPIPDVVTDCNGPYTITHNSIYSNTPNGPDASGDYPVGTTNITFTVVDYCNKVAKCNINVTVRDGKKPSPVVIKGLAVDLMDDPINPGGTITLIPEWFDAGSFDNCTANQDLVFSITPSVFNCDSLGERNVWITVTDESGNTETVETYVVIQDNDGACINTFTANVSGEVETENGERVPSIDMMAMSNENPKNKNVDGIYMLDSLAGNDHYEIIPSKNNDVLNGITTKDLIILRNHIIAKESIYSPYKLIAADVDGNNEINTQDLIALRKLVLGTEDGLPINKSWRFVDRSFTFDPFLPALSQAFREKVVIDKLQHDMTDVSFIGVKLGDLNGTVNLFGMNESETRGDNSTMITAFANNESTAETKIDLKLDQSMDVNGLQLALKWDPSQMTFISTSSEHLDGLNTDLSINKSKVNQGKLFISIVNKQNHFVSINDVLMTLQFKVSHPDVIPQLSIDEQGQLSELYDDYNSYNVRLSNELVKNTGDFELYQNKPNPFKNNTTIGFNLPERADVTLEIFDMSGSLVNKMEGKYEKGINQMNLNLGNLKGVFYYRLTAGDRIGTKKMVVLD